MAAGGSSTQASIRWLLGAIKDSTKVGIAQISSDNKDLDIAIVKATNHVECVPKEKHVKTIFAATSVARPRADVAYCIHALARRVEKTHNWAVALKTLMVVHRTLRDGDPTFREELVHFSQSRRLAFNLSNFKDDSSPSAWDYSAFIRAYALYLEERLECSRTLGCDIESDHILKMKELHTVDLLQQLPALQQLLYRSMGCQPEGASYSNYIIQCALNLVLKESVRIYKAISDGMINLVDKFFEMQRSDASKALEIYRRNGQQTEKLSDFYNICKGLDFSRNLKYPPLEQPPLSFLSSMEQYVHDAPRQSSFNRKSSMEDRDDHVAKKSVTVLALEYDKQTKPEEIAVPPPLQVDKSVSPPTTPVATPSSANVDLLGLDDVQHYPHALEESNALALAIVPTSSGTMSAPNAKGIDTEAGVTGWELALVTTASSSDNAANQSKLAGGFDRLALDSLYEDAISRKAYSTQSSFPNGMNQLVSNPFQSSVQRDPFFASATVASPQNVQFAALAHQQQTMMMQQHYYQLTMMQQLHQSMMMQQQYQHVFNSSIQQPVNPYASYGMPNYVMMQPGSNSQMHSNPFGNPNLM